VATQWLTEHRRKLVARSTALRPGMGIGKKLPLGRASARHFASVAWLIPSSCDGRRKGMLFGSSIFVRTAAFLCAEHAKSSSCPARLRVYFQK